MPVLPQTLRAIGTVALGGILVAAGCNQDRRASAVQVPAVVVELPSADEAAREPLLPWSLELWADIVALGTVGSPIRHRDGRLLPVRLTEILKGQAAVTEVFPADEAPWLGCLPPKRIPRPSERLVAGSRVLVYLTRSGDGGLSILQIGPAPESIDYLRDFFALEARLGDPDLDWQGFFAEQGPGLDDRAYYVLSWGPLPSAATAALDAALERSVGFLAANDAGQRGRARIVHLVALASRSDDPALLPTLLLLTEQQLTGVALDGSLLPSGRMLARLEEQDAARWNAALRDLLARAHAEHNVPLYERAAHCLAALPRDLGIPTLLIALDDHRPELVAALIHRQQAWTDEELRSEVHAKARQLLTVPELQRDEQLVFRRHLEWLLEVP